MNYPRIYSVYLVVVPYLMVQVNQTSGFARLRK